VTIAVTFHVGADGRVVAVSLSPEPGDRGFARKLEDVMKQYRFRPARSADGLPVPGTTIVSLTF
jgi:outer membrane biosynthesis protein TonB